MYTHIDETSVEKKQHIMVARKSSYGSTRHNKIKVVIGSSTNQIRVLDKVDFVLQILTIPSRS